MIDANNPEAIYSKRKAITTFFPYAVWRKRDGQHETLDTLLRAAGASGEERAFTWICIQPFFTTLLDEESHTSLKQAAILASPYLPWRNQEGTANDERLVQLWAAESLAIPSTDENDQTIVDTLLQIASNDSLRPHIPIGMWSLLNRRPTLPPTCSGRKLGTHRKVIRTVRALGNPEILTSYLLLVWSEWNSSNGDIHDETNTSIREDLGGIGMEQHREDLLRRLNEVLGELNLGFKHLRQRNPNVSRRHAWGTDVYYEEFKRVVLEVDKEAGRLQTREPQVDRPLQPTNSCARVQNPARRSYAHSLRRVRSCAVITSPTTSLALQLCSSIGLSHILLRICYLTPPLLYSHYPRAAVPTSGSPGMMISALWSQRCVPPSCRF